MAKTYIWSNAQSTARTSSCRATINYFFFAAGLTSGFLNGLISVEKYLSQRSAATLLSLSADSPSEELVTTGPKSRLYSIRSLGVSARFGHIRFALAIIKLRRAHWTLMLFLSVAVLSNKFSISNSMYSFSGALQLLAIKSPIAKLAAAFTRQSRLFKSLEIIFSSQTFSIC